MLTPHNSFIVQVDTRANPLQGRYFGRVENVATGEWQNFQTLGDLLLILGALPGSDAANRTRERSVPGANR